MAEGHFTDDESGIGQRTQDRREPVGQKRQPQREVVVHLSDFAMPQGLEGSGEEGKKVIPVVVLQEIEVFVPLQGAKRTAEDEEEEQARQD